MSVLFIGRRGLLSGERAACEARLQVTCRELCWESLSIPSSIEPVPVACRWWLPPATSLDAFTFQVGFIEALERLGTRIVNPPRAVLGCDKLSVATTWHRALRPVARQVAFPPTIVTADPDAARAFVAEHERVVSKPLTGQGGHGVTFIDGQARDGDAMLETLIRARGVLLLQAAVPDVAFEVRTIVAGETVVNTHGRIRGGDFANLSRGGTVIPLEDPRIVLAGESRDDIEAMAVRIAGLAGLDLVAVDFMIDGSGTAWLVEWNPFFGYGGSGSLHAVVEAAIVDVIHRKVLEGR